MQPFDISLHDLGHEWIGWVATLIGLAVFALVAKLLLRHDLSLGVKLDLLKLALAKLDLKRRARRLRRQPVPVAIRSVEAIEQEWHALTGIIETRADRLHAVGSLQQRARQCIEAAEYTLDRLIADCSAVLLTRHVDDLVLNQRRGATKDPIPTEAPVRATALPDSLAA